MWLFAAGWLLLINVLTAATFAFDKRRAREGGGRVPERRLLQLAAVGGSPAALACSELLRHKTRKQPFRARLRIVCGGQALLAVLAVWLFA
jgi:uncharacterized membrane protein YsdA (DUF1294 family)